MGNAQEVERANAELYLVRKKMEKTVKKIRDLLQPREFDELPFPDMKKILLKNIRQCEGRIVELQKRQPNMVKKWDKYYHDFSRMTTLLNKVKFRPDLTDKKVIDEIFPAPKLKKLDDNFFDEFEDKEKAEGKEIAAVDHTNVDILDGDGGEFNNFDDDDDDEDDDEEEDDNDNEEGEEEGTSSEEEGESSSESEGEEEEEGEGEYN